MTEPTPPIDTNPYEDPLVFSEEGVTAIEIVEHLPYSQAFEQVMHDNLLERHTSYTATDPIVITPRLRATQFPEELRDLFLIDGQTLKFRDITITQSTGSAYDTSVSMAFAVNDRVCQLDTNDSGEVDYRSHNLNGDPLLSTLSRQSIEALIAALAYAQQYNADPQASITLREDPLILERPDYSTALIERMLLTLGDHNGRTIIDTSALFPTADGMISAELRQAETTNLSGINTSLSLSRIVHDSMTLTSVHQRSVNTVSQYEPRLENKFADIELLPPSNRPDYAFHHRVIPEQSPEEWASLCEDFCNLVHPQISIYEAFEVDGLG